MTARPASASYGIVPSVFDLSADVPTLARLAADGRQTVIVHPVQQRRVEKDGKTVVKPTQFVTAGVLVRAPLEVVRSVVLDFEKHTAFLPQAKSIRVVAREGDKTQVAYELALTFFVVTVGVDYTLEYTTQPNGAITWRVVSGDLDEDYGAWEFVPVDEGSTLVFYTLWADHRSQGFLVRKALDAQPALEQALAVSTPVVMTEGLRAYVERTWKPGGRATSGGRPSGAVRRSAPSGSRAGRRDGRTK